MSNIKHCLWLACRWRTCDTTAPTAKNRSAIITAHTICSYFVLVLSALRLIVSLYPSICFDFGIFMVSHVEQAPVSIGGAVMSFIINDPEFASSLNLHDILSIYVSELSFHNHLHTQSHNTMSPGLLAARQHQMTHYALSVSQSEGFCNRAHIHQAPLLLPTQLNPTVFNVYNANVHNSLLCLSP